MRLGDAGRTKMIRRTALVALLGFLLSACGTATPPTAAAVPSTLTIALPAQTSLNWWPPFSPSTDCYTLTGGGADGADMYMPLLWVDRQDQVDYGRSVASSVTPSNGDTTFTIQMNPTWKWSNGHPITAKDVLFDWQLIKASMSSKSPLPYCFGGEGGVPQDWKSVVATGTHTLVITTTKAVNPVWFTLNGIGQLIPIPVSVWDKHPTNMLANLSFMKQISNQPMNPVYQVVDGPYVIQKTVHDQYWEYKANPTYHGHKPSVKHVLYMYNTASSNLFVQLKKQAFNESTIPFSYLGAAKQLTGYNVVSKPAFQFNDIELNFASNAAGVGGLFNKLYIRQALQMGINQQAIITSLYHGLASPTYGPVPLRPKNVFYDKSLPNYYPFNPAAGRKLLEQHGWTLSNGVMTKGSQRFEFTVLYYSGSTTLQHLVEYLQSEWATEGIKVNLQSMNPTNLSGITGNTQDSSKWAALVGNYWVYVPDYYPSGGGLFATGAGFNQGQYNSAVMNHLIAKTYEGGTTSQVTARFNQYQAYVAQQLPVLWLPTPQTVYAVSKNLHGFNQWYNPIVAFARDNRLSLTAP